VWQDDDPSEKERHVISNCRSQILMRPGRDLIRTREKREHTDV
jgi:hypothetical protein